MNPLVIYHADCADGFGAAFAAWTMLGDEAEYVPMKYGEEFCLDPRQRDVYILDFSFKRDTMDFIFEFADYVAWLDHHKTAFEMWLDDKHDFTAEKYLTEEDRSYAVYGDNKLIVLNNWKSGAVLAWEYFHSGGDVPMLIQHIDDRDRWQFKLEGTKEFMAALFSLQPWDFRQWRDFLIHPEMKRQRLITEGAAILRDHVRQVQTITKNATKCYFENPYGGDNNWMYAAGLAVNCPPFLASDVGHELATKSGTFGLCWHMDAQGVVKCSLRSNGEYDVSDIAKSYGGGGHKNAAGFSLSIEQLMGWLK